MSMKKSLDHEYLSYVVAIANTTQKYVVDYLE